MSLSQIDKKAALIVIDMQKGILRLPVVHPKETIVENVAELARLFRKHHRPVVLVNVAGGAPGRTENVHDFKPADDWAELIAEMEAGTEDLRVTKHQWGAFHGTDLHEKLRERGVTQLFIVGIATSIGVESTARSAYDLGYNVVLVTDAMTDLDQTNHQHSVQRVFPSLGETTTLKEVAACLQA